MKPIISLVEPENASETARAAAEAHLAKGYRLTNEKRTLLHNAVAFNALEDMSYAVSAEMKKFTGSRAANLFEYAISLENDCLVCSTYYRKTMAALGIEDLDAVELTEDEELLVPGRLSGTGSIFRTSCLNGCWRGTGKKESWSSLRWACS